MPSSGSSAIMKSTAFVSLCGAGFLGRLGYEMVRSPVTALFARHLGAPVALVGLLVSAVTITGIVVKLPAGSLADLFGFRRLMLAGLVVKATAPFLYLAVSAWLVLLLVRLYHGLSTALYAPAASALVARSFPAERARRLGLYGAAENAGVVLGPVLGGFVLAGAGFSAAFLLAGAIGIAALLAILPLPRDAPHDAPGSALHAPAPPGAVWRKAVDGVRQIAGDRRIRLVSLVEGSLYAGVGTLQAYLPLYALSVSIPVSRIGFLFAGQAVASVVGRPLLGALADRIGRRPPIVAGMLLAAVTLALVPHVAGFQWLLLLGTVFGLGTALVTPATTALIGDLTRGGSFGAAMGVFGSLWDVGHAGGPLLAGLLVGVFGYGVAFAVVATCLLAALVAFLVLFRGPGGPAS